MSRLSYDLTRAGHFKVLCNVMFFSAKFLVEFFCCLRLETYVEPVTRSTCSEMKYLAVEVLNEIICIPMCYLLLNLFEGVELSDLDCL